VSDLEQHLNTLLGARIEPLTPIAGGDINLAFRTSMQGQRLFVKTHDTPPRDMYRREAEGLTLLADANTLRVPRVIAVSERALVLEWIESRPPCADYDEQLGRGLARLHEAGAPSFGLAHDNYVGSLPQDNTPHDSWPSFYGERRLLPLAHRARDRGLLDPRMMARVERLCARLPALCGDAEPASRLHGDLWSGNVMRDEAGAPTLVDPAVYGGQCEMDLAMLALFGSPSARFFAAYDEQYPRLAGAAGRVALYQLYPLLVHVCLFGTSYLSALSRALTRYE